jgi:glycosyltransferase involved in cell wall biosynthesis
MKPSVLLRKFRSAKFRAGEARERWQSVREAAQRQRAFNLWLDGLRRNPPEVLVGSNFVEFGGTRHHMHAIKRFSSLDVALAPSDEALTTLSPNHFKVDFRQQFLNFKATGIKAVHSHIFPWFVEWCRQYQQNGGRWIHTHHNWYYPEFGKGGLEPWQEELNKTFIFALSNADVRLSVSRWQQAFLKKTHGLETQYLPNGVDVGICDKADSTRFRGKMGDSRFVLYVGRNDPVKNPGDFVRLARRLPRQKFAMLGHGLSRDILRDDWELEAPANLVIDGPASHLEVQDAIAACSALVVTSKREGLPTLVLEGMAHGKPIVVPNEDGCMEAIGNGEFGFIYRQGDVEDLAENVVAAIADKKRCTGARQRVLSEYDWRVVCAKLDAIYRG